MRSAPLWAETTSVSPEASKTPVVTPIGSSSECGTRLPFCGTTTAAPRPAASRTSGLN